MKWEMLRYVVVKGLNNHRQLRKTNSPVTVSWTRIRDTQPLVFTCTMSEFHGLSLAPHIRMSFTRVALRESAIRAVEWENSRR